MAEVAFRLIRLKDPQALLATVPDIVELGGQVCLLDRRLWVASVLLGWEHVS